MARARQAAYARQLVEIQTPQFKAGADGQLVPDVRATAAIIYNPATHEVLYESNAQTPRSIASITKVMTAVAFLENEVDFTREVTIHPDDLRGASTTYLRRNDTVTIQQLLHLLLIGSDNVAARTLARASLYGPTRLRRADEPEGCRTRPRRTRATSIRPGSTPTTCRRPSTWRG